MSKTISAIIPTKNRPSDLRRAVLSVLRQTRAPDELVIIDQSDSVDSRDLVKEVVSVGGKMELVYVLNRNIKGLVDAKRHSLDIASGELVCFLEDDITLDEFYFEEIEKGFLNNPEMIGCCGVVTNMPTQPVGYELIYKIFHRGIFRDNRVGVFGKTTGRENRLIQSDMISGGMSAWRREVFDSVKFDTLNGFHISEDNDFSTRVAMCFGSRLYINPNARLEHHASLTNRATAGGFQEKKIIAHFTYFKKRRNLHWATTAFVWLMIGQLFEAIYQTVSKKSFSPIVGFFRGVLAGIRKKVVM